MRPVRLEMNGFAAFRDDAVVDFTDTDFFVLVGATGSGKSTVIDALTFALYGTVPRWDHRSMVKYGLTPTANQGKVSLVFDVGEQRYLVARELRRAKSGGVTVRNARLDRLIDPGAAGEIDDDVESVAADSGVTPAVEKILGLAYEHFCQCVVLPQGEFADFLRAKPADRRTILLKLLGAGLYTDIGQRANHRASLAGQRADVLAEQLGDLVDATEEAEIVAEKRESDLSTLERTVRQNVPRLRAAGRELESAQENLDRIVAEQAALTAIAVPADVVALDAAHATAAEALTDADAAERAARQADRSARDRLAAAPDRPPLDQVLRDHADRDRVTAALPEAMDAARRADSELTQATEQAFGAASALERARSARDIAQAAVTELTGQADRIGTEIEMLDAVVVPDGLAALAGRASAAAQTATEAAAALSAAQAREVAAQDALVSAPARGPIEELLRLVVELAQARHDLEPLADEQARTAVALRAADAAVLHAERERDAARAAREHAWSVHRAAALRSELIAGQTCPVCDQLVSDVPAALDDHDLRAADDALQARESTVTTARSVQVAASAAQTQAVTRLAMARQHVATLTDRLADRSADRPGDPDVLRRTLAEIDDLEAAQRTASALVRARRVDHEAAAAAAKAVDAEVTTARAGLRAARDPLVALGAPALDESDLLAAWTALVDWASSQRRTRRSGLRATQVALTAAEEAFGQARSRFAQAQERADDAHRAVNAATAGVGQARAGLEVLQARQAELESRLATAPGVQQVTEQLRRIDEMTEAVKDAGVALESATGARAAAESALGSLSTRVRQAWRDLRTVRDAVIGLGAPDLPDGSVLAGWTTLSAWAGAAARSRAAAVPDAQDAVTAATRHSDEAAKHLTDEFAALGIDIGGVAGDDLADTAPVAAAAALAQASAERARIAERRARAVAVSTELAKAQDEQQVARMLGNLLRSNQFPEWLESAALDTLVVDASRRLTELSGGQFELTHRDGEFMVVDHADADSIRSVRTLSGGETFQASLALALSLSTQLSSMAAEGAARLDSIFLDEGFGTLDDATLDVVASTLENLAQGDRMVGVVTHVGALADRIPVRFRVRRDSRTSSIERESL